MTRKTNLLVLAAAAIAAMPALAMPIGLRTAVWGISASNRRSAVARLLPAAGSTAEIGEVLGGFSDPAVAANIANDSDYGEFREWALESGARVEALTNSPTTWLSFAVGAPALLAEPKAGDLAIDDVSPTGEDGNVELVFSLEDVAIDKHADEARLKSVFGVVGNPAMNETKFTEDNLAYSLSPTDDGRVRATVTPKKDSGGRAPDSFFMRVKMK
jgi:hypothetical protein